MNNITIWSINEYIPFKYIYRIQSNLSHDLCNKIIHISIANSSCLYTSIININAENIVDNSFTLINDINLIPHTSISFDMYITTNNICKIEIDDCLTGEIITFVYQYKNKKLLLINRTIRELFQLSDTPLDLLYI